MLFVCVMDGIFPNLPPHCACGSKFDVQHSLSCKKGGFVILRQNSLRDLTANILKEVCKDVSVEPPILSLTGERFVNKTTRTGDEAKPAIVQEDFGLVAKGHFYM